MILRAKTKTLFSGAKLSAEQTANSELNISELERGEEELHSLPRRIVLELTNACNLNCVMCARNAADFKLTQFDMAWFYALEPLFDTVEEVTLMGWGEPTIHPNFAEMLQIINRHSARKYFCTNGMRLDKLTKVIFDSEVDVFAVSVDGATPETNGAIRRGSDLEKINRDLRKIKGIQKTNNFRYPHVNYVFCAMKRNLKELPQMVEMAADVGLDEVKVVFLTAFSNEFAQEILWDCTNEVEDVFGATAEIADKLGVQLKLPYVQGSDPAGEKLHRDCFVGYRDFYLGSDGFTRPCMSTAEKYSAFDQKKHFRDIWNSDEYKRHRVTVNTCEMSLSCRSCYQSSHCNWNNKKSYLQIGEIFSPQWATSDE
jgi:MoaA/NifB/PqqE/SkfB family radical SAM enzyme